MADPILPVVAPTGAPVVAPSGEGASCDDQPRPLAARPPVPAPRGRYYIHTWGCQMNVHDSERMAGLLEGIGFGQAAREEDADVVLLNTCTVRESAAVKVQGKLGDLKRLKRRREHLVVGVCGCLAQQERDALFATAPHLDIVLGPRAIPQLPRHVEHVVATRERVRDTGAHADTFGDGGGEDSLRQSFPKAYVTVQEGCDKFCTFCVVPFTRGREKCRPLDALVGEVEALAARGFREVELLGQNVNCWSEGDRDFADLLHAVAAVRGIERVRFVTSHPRHFSDRIADAMAHPGLAASLHLPVQSGSDAVLEAMGRDYTRALYLERVDRVRRARPDVALQTDVIVGFPGETDEDFEQTLSLLEEVGYDTVYSFKYSPRPFTKAAKHLPDDVPESAKAERLARLQALQDALQAPRDAARVGLVEEVLVDGVSKRSPDDVAGRTSRNRVVNLPGGPELIGRIVPVRITEAKAHSFRGEVAGPPR